MKPNLKIVSCLVIRLLVKCDLKILKHEEFTECM